MRHTASELPSSWTVMPNPWRSQTPAMGARGESSCAAAWPGARSVETRTTTTGKRERSIWGARVGTSCAALLEGRHHLTRKQLHRPEHPLLVQVAEPEAAVEVADAHEFLDAL